MSGRKTQKAKRETEQICIGRVCFEKDKYQPTPGAKYRYHEHRCTKPCEEGKNLCKYCLANEEKYLTGDPRKWHGRHGGPLPEESHIENSAWDLEWRVKEAAAVQKQVIPKSEKAKVAIKKATEAVKEIQMSETNKIGREVNKVVREANKVVREAEMIVVQEATKVATEHKNIKSKRTTQRRKKNSSPLRIYRPGSAATTERSNRKSMSRGQATPYSSPQKPSVSPIGSPADMMRRNWATPYGSMSPSTSSVSPAIMPIVTVKKATTSPVPSSASSVPSSNSTNLGQYAENLLLA